jgi:dipeptidyl aminopeptidase/acylaminoacyl peptidase
MTDAGRASALLFLALFASSANASDVPTGVNVAPYMDQRYPRHLAAASEGAGAAWIQTAGDATQVMFHASGASSPRLVASFTGDDGIAITGLRLSPDARFIAFERGNAAAPGTMPPDPAQRGDDAQPGVWLVATVGAEAMPQRLGDGGNLVFSSDSRRLAFSNGGQLFEVELSSDQTGSGPFATKRLANLYGALGDLSYSPIDHRIAMRVDRGRHSFIAVYDPGRQTTAWVGPSVYRDRHPQWSPDGRSIAFLRLAGLLHREKFDITRAEPFVIAVANLETGDVKVAHQSGPRAGGYAYLSGSPIRWPVADRIIFQSEETGWLHFYSVSPAGGSVTALTSGSCEVFSSDVSARAQSLFYESNCENLNQRTISRVTLNGEGRCRVTPTDVQSSGPVVASEGRTLYFLRSSATMPVEVAMMSGDRTSVVSQGAGTTFGSAPLVKPEDVTFRAADGVIVHGQLFRPPGGETRMRAGIVFVHGGPQRQMLPAFHAMPYYARTYAINQALANAGFTVLSVNFRAGVGYGQDFRLADRQGPRGASEYQDVLAAHKYLVDAAGNDPKKVGIWGGSYGGYLTALALARNSDLFAAGVDVHGVHDWATLAEDENGALWGLSSEDLALARLSSPIADVDNWRSPVLFIHGDRDGAVTFAETVDIATRLMARGNSVTTLVIPDEEHDFLRNENWIEVGNATVEYFQLHLQK